VLAKPLTASGPLLATFFVGLFVQTLPALAYSRRRSTVGRHRAGRSTPRTVGLTPAPGAAIATTVLD
jgi:hypothetical protein